MLATQHYTEMLEAQQQKAAVVEEHMLEKATLECFNVSMSLKRRCINSSCG